MPKDVKDKLKSIPGELAVAYKEEISGFNALAEGIDKNQVSKVSDAQDKK